MRTLNSCRTTLGGRTISRFDVPPAFSQRSHLRHDNVLRACLLHAQNKPTSLPESGMSLSRSGSRTVLDRLASRMRCRTTDRSIFGESMRLKRRCTTALPKSKGRMNDADDCRQVVRNRFQYSIEAKVMVEELQPSSQDNLNS